MGHNPFMTLAYQPYRLYLAMLEANVVDSSQYTVDSLKKLLAVSCLPFTTPLIEQSEIQLESLRFGLLRIRSPLLPQSLFTFSSPGYLDVSVSLLTAINPYKFRIVLSDMTRIRFPHSDIFGSKLS